LRAPGELATLTLVLRRQDQSFLRSSRNKWLGEQMADVTG
jgi:hypothetical protein